MMPLRGALQLTLAMGLASLTLVLLASSSAADAEPRATDGRVLSGETLATQAMFHAVWGDRAAQRCGCASVGAGLDTPVFPAAAAVATSTTRPCCGLFGVQKREPAQATVAHLGRPRRAGQ